MPSATKKEIQKIRKRRSVRSGDKLATVGDWGTPLATFVAAASPVAQAIWTATVGTLFAAIGGGLGFLLSLVGLTGRRLQRSDRRTRAATAVLRYLAQDAFDVPDNHGESVPPNRQFYRVTAFWPETIDGTPTLVPMLRATTNGKVETSDSLMYFHKEDAFAGLAWQMEDPIGLDDLKSLRDCGGNRTAWLAQWTLAGVKRIEDMGQGRSKYIEDVRSIACFRISSEDVELVIAVDSVFRNAFRREFLKYAKSKKELFLFAGIIGREVARSD